MFKNLGIDLSFKPKPGEANIRTINPATGELLAEVAGCNLKDYQHCINQSTAYFKIWQQVPAPKRGEMIRRIGENLRKHKQDLGQLVSLEMGKSLEEGLGEVQEMIDIADFAVGLSRQLYGKTMHSERPLHRMYEQWHPLGVVGVISSFNFPVAVWAWNAFIAAVCGNTVVWKPSSKTPLCAIAVNYICNQVITEMGYTGVFSLLVSGSHEVVSTLIADKRVSLISFTGSTHTGKQVAQIVASRLGRSLLELGGNNAIILDETADLTLAIPGVVFSAVGTAGQRCTTARRLFVHSSRLDEVVRRLQSAYQQVTPELTGPLIDQKAVQEFEKAVQACQAMGGEILFGGKKIDRSGYYVMPTLMRAENHWPIVQQETFGPILYIMSYNTIEEAINLNNQVPQGLSSSLFTQSFHHAEQFLAQVGSDCGIANINIGTSGAEIGGAFGGEKETGGGREAGSDAWQAYMRRQTNTLNWGNTLPLAQGIRFEIEHGKNLA